MPSARKSWFTYAAPPLVEPPSQVSRSLAAVVGRDDRLAEQRVEPAAARGLLSEPAKHLDRDRDLDGRRGGESCTGVPGGTGAGAQVLDVDATDPGKAREAADRAGQEDPRRSSSAARAAQRPPGARRRVDRRRCAAAASSSAVTVAGRRAPEAGRRSRTVSSRRPRATTRPSAADDHLRRPDAHGR